MTLPPRGNTEEVQDGRARNPQEEEHIKDWSAWVEDSSLSPRGKPVGVKHPSGQVAAGRGPRTLASEFQNRKTSSDPPNTQQDQQPLSPVFRVLKQSQDPNLRNPLNDIFGTLGQDYGMQLDKPDLKRPHQSSASSSDKVGNLCKQAATETPQTEGPSGSKLPDT
ncbi:hypothetical protein MRX96_045003 [Rhipicephalus microplus]